MFGRRTQVQQQPTPLFNASPPEPSGQRPVEMPPEAAATTMLMLQGPARWDSDGAEVTHLRLPGLKQALSVPRSACIRNSAFFGPMLQPSSAWAESKAPELQLHDVNTAAAESILRWLAGGKLSLRADNLVSTFQLSDQWQVEGLETQCLELTPLLISPSNADELFCSATGAGLDKLSLRIAESAWLWQKPVGGEMPRKPSTSVAWAKLCRADEDLGRFDIFAMWHAPDALRLGTESTPALPVGSFELTLTRTVTGTPAGPERADFEASLRLQSDSLKGSFRLSGNEVVRREEVVMRYELPSSIQTVSGARSTTSRVRDGWGGRTRRTLETPVADGRLDATFSHLLVQYRLQGIELKDWHVFEPDRHQHFALRLYVEFDDPRAQTVEMNQMYLS